MEKKGLGILIAAAAAYGIYRLYKMTPEEKELLKEKGRKFWEENIGFGNMFSKKHTEEAVS